MYYLHINMNKRILGLEVSVHLPTHAELIYVKINALITLDSRQMEINLVVCITTLQLCVIFGLDLLS